MLRYRNRSGILKYKERGKMKEVFMNYREWLDSVPAEISNDPIWKLEVYRLALFAGDIGWHDVLALSKNTLTRSTADQLNRSLGSISVNLTEGYSRSKGLDRARFLEYSLGSARESRDWYYKSRQVLNPKVVEHRMGLMTKIVAMLTPMIRHQRKNSIREEKTEYATSDRFNLETEIPMP